MKVGVVALATLALVLWIWNRSVSSPSSRPDAVRARSESESHERMLKTLADIAKRTPDDNPWLGDKEARRLRPIVASIDDNSITAPQWWDLFRLGVEELRLGHERRAVELLVRVVELHPSVAPAVPARWLNVTRFRLGVAYIRLAETENCCQRSLPESCTLPLTGTAVHTDTEGADGAIRVLASVLESTAPQSDLHMMSVWLFNFAHMFAGRFPEGVPEAFRLPAQAFASEATFPRFRNVAKSLGLDTFSLSGGVVVDDFDNDGDFDLMVSTWATDGQLRLYLCDRAGRFVDHTEAAGLMGITGGLNLIQGDFDNDGNIDVYVLRGAWMAENGRHPNSLLRNVGGAAFRDVTFHAGLGDQHYPTQTAAWADYDTDGDLDLYVGNESNEELAAPSQLFRNNGDGTFVDCAARAGVTNDRYTKGVVWGDFDDDGDPDLFVSNLGDGNRLYRNNGDGTFDDMAPRLGMTMPARSFPTWFWDFDNDGDLDLYVSGYGADIWHLAAQARGVKTKAERARLWRNDGKGRFQDVATAFGVDRLSAPMGANFGDLDNDGWLDFYLGTGFPSYDTVMPNVMYRQDSGRRFVDVSTVGGFAHLQKGHAIAFADLDRDGDQDVFEQMGGAFAGDGFYDVLYENPGFGNHSIVVRLVGVLSNRSAIGARIHLRVRTDGQIRSIYRFVGSGGSFGANPLTQMIGVGKATKIESLTVRWPRRMDAHSYRTQTWRNLDVDQAVTITEREQTYKATPWRR